MDAKAMQERLDEFYAEMSSMITDVGVQAVAETDLDEVLDMLRERGLWGEPNDVTLASIASGGSRTKAEAFGTLTTGNAVIQRVLKDFYVSRKGPKPPAPPAPETPAAAPSPVVPTAPVAPVATKDVFVPAVKRGPGGPPGIKNKNG